MDLDKYNTFGKCRFCHSEGFHRDLMTEYNLNGLREVYFDIFQECFNLYLCIASDQSKLICLACIKQLEDAKNFRAMVVKAEQDLLEISEREPFFVNLNDKWTKPTDCLYEVKIEDKVKSEDEYSSDPDFNTEYSLTLDSEDELVKGEAELISRFSKETLKPLPTRATIYNTCCNYAKHLDSLKGKKITAAALNLLFHKQKKCSSIYLTEKSALVNNITELLQNTNMAPFKRMRRAGILCFYCSKTVDSFLDLHIHQDTENCKETMNKILNKRCAESLVIYSHITELKCTICDTELEYNSLKTHLMTVHKKKFYPQGNDRVVPFKLIKGNEFHCQICGFSFETFGSIERHMNTHYRNYVCDQCGAGYMTKSRLKVHWRYSHSTGAFPCDTCKKVFPSQHKYNCHVDAVHRSVKKNKCTKCPARFADYFNKHKHMVEVHGEPPLEYKCNVCDAVFKRRYALLCHVRRRHLEVKNIECKMCSYKCYTTTELKVHMIKHVGERTYQCTVCKKAYARKKTLKEHMRIHTNDRRYVCAVCGQGFVQNCSLKGHMRSHHADYVNEMGLN
ncbi:unnamed protein product [Leptosia nina]|uniref:Uncharacterized protein n=1 Tax=Leptosia nina TaxID=320188 RepID=A0AAV1JZW0_9NEOP